MKSKAELKKLNIGCGRQKLTGYINIDAEPKCKPDLVLDISTEKLPYSMGSIQEVLMFHCIEHIKKVQHWSVLSEISRVLTKGGKLFLTYPNFEECARRWVENVDGKRTFWEATIYGRQLYPGDYHVCAIQIDELIVMLREAGFGAVRHLAEPAEPQNMLVVATKKRPSLPSYEDLVRADMLGMHIAKLERGSEGNGTNS